MPQKHHQIHQDVFHFAKVVGIIVNPVSWQLRWRWGCETMVKDGVLGCSNATKINIATYLDPPSTCTDKYCVLTCFNLCFFYQYNFRDIWRVQIETSCPANSGRPCTGAMKPYHLGSPESIMFSSMNKQDSLQQNTVLTYLKISHFTPLRGLRLTASHRPVR